DKTWGDLLPAQLIGGTKYFYEGFTGFEKTALSLKLTEHSEETGTSATHLSGGALETPTKS
ncbi:MAG TPA: hypothetical protein VGO47_00045, partial [Chlamydiales bacterium]|nr:hypothetical protein [Chlamydiales bacterium]